MAEEYLYSLGADIWTCKAMGGCTSICDLSMFYSYYKFMLFQIYPSDVEAQLSKIAEMHMDCDFYGCSFSDNKLIHLRDNQLSIWHYEVDTLITTGIGRGYNHVVLFSIPLLRLVGLSFRTDFGLRQDYKRFTNFWCLNLAHKFHVCGHAIISFILCFLRWRR